MLITINEPWPRTTHQEKKYGRGRVYEPALLKSAREWWMLMLRINRPWKPFTGALRVVIEFDFKSKKRGYRTERPDFDNLTKLPCDCMAACGFFANDAQIADGRAIKRNAEADAVRITIEELTT
jgi:Holliday junction resolvase RusA-like endonuclease